MKKILKNVLLCILCVSIGIFIGINSKKLIKNMFSKANSSAESVVEHFVQATYNKDKDTMIKCLSPDLNNVDKLKKFKSKGSKTASDILAIYEHNLYYKKNPPKDLSKEDMKAHNSSMEKIEKGNLVEVYVDFLLNNTGAKGKDIKEEHIGVKSLVDEKYYEGKNVDKDYLDMKFSITLNNNGDISKEDENIVIQNKEEKYYIVDMDM
ncbi:hypothetical protein [Terrisporobacter mayombei]|uniref:Lipoprotein n=1 Tax=Terrisporobacter mayombei TaxID=1541 RepID=A0ABY9PYS6_9FIRM|nr:hypothetical protein [Terrisporobacter mayombei]MCC3868651.1 hypothetical protein [Terrisporobacter mayombei]WMT80807.1 hypothetical protein TEMA_11290 [Terrisporobacter mayombei]